jgi:SAM-dependent methyltransferase
MVIKAGHLGGNARGGDRHSIERSLWAWLKEEYRLDTVLDLGCGQGNALQIFRDLGYIPIGLEGLKQNCDALDTPPIICKDLTLGSLYISGIDLVWCCELVEHVEERYLGNLLNTMCVGRVIAMTHGLPGQAGYHHVNCQPPEYWIEKITTRGYRLVSRDRYEDKIRRKYFRRSGLVFVRTV